MLRQRGQDGGARLLSVGKVLRDEWGADAGHLDGEGQDGPERGEARGDHQGKTGADACARYEEDPETNTEAWGAGAS